MGGPIIISTLLTKSCFQVEIFSLTAGNATIGRIPRCLLRTVGNVLVGQRSISVFLNELGQRNIAEQPSIDYKVGLHGSGLQICISAAVAGDYDVHGLGQKLLIGEVCFGLVNVPSEGDRQERLPHLGQLVADQDQIDSQHAPFYVGHLGACEGVEGSGGQLGSRDDAWWSDDSIAADQIQGISVEGILLSGIMINLRKIMIGLGVMAVRGMGVQVESTHRGQQQTHEEERRSMVFHAKLF